MRKLSATTNKRRSALSMIIRTAVLGIGAIVIFASTRDAAACRPVMPKWDYGHTIGELKRAEAVFVGVAVSAKDARAPRSTRGRLRGTSTAIMTVEKVWKGKPGRRVTVVSNYDKCRGYGFSAGKRYLVFVSSYGRAYLLAWPWAFRGGKAPAAVMKALADYTTGKVRKATAWYPVGAPAHKGLTVARFRELAASRRPEDRVKLRRYMAQIIKWGVDLNLKAIRSKSYDTTCLLPNTYQLDADFDRLIAETKKLTDELMEYYYAVGHQYSPVAKYVIWKIRQKHPRHRSVTKSDGTYGEVDRCPEAERIAGADKVRKGGGGGGTDSD
jgi:hypothetical protein